MMRQDDVIIKWTGSKRLQSPQIIKHFPNQIHTYYEPFLGGGSMLYVLMKSNVSVKHYECSDLNETLIALWHLIKDCPEKLYDFYTSHWPFEKDDYYSLRDEFNKDHDAKKFFCLLRTCRNGLVRYNNSGKFTSAFHQQRKGVSPEKLHPVLFDWSKLLKEHDVQFFVRDYRELKLVNSADFLYLDPPYRMTGRYYFGEIDFNSFWDWLEEQDCGYALSLNGFKDDVDLTVQVPSHLYDQHQLIYNGTNKFDQLVGNHVIARDSLYVKRGRQ